jgi:hypothetical protein
MGKSMSKLSLSRAWEETLSVLARDGRLFLAVALALFVLPGLVLNVSMPPLEPNQLPHVGLWMIVAVIAVLLSLVGQLAVIRLAMEPHVAVGEAITHALARLLPYIAAMLIWTVPVLLIGSGLYGFLAANPAHPSVTAALALIILCFVGAFIAVRLMLSSAVASAENVGPIGILRRSWVLSSHNWWRLFVFLVLFAIGALCLLWAIDSVFGLLVRMIVEDAGPRSIGGLIISIISQLVSALLSVTFFVMLARIYVQRSESSGDQGTVPSSGI